MSLDISPEVTIATKTEISVAVIYHSNYGHTKLVAEHVFKGVSKVKNVTAVLLSVDEAEKKIDELPNYDAFIFGSPTYFGSISAGLKGFLEKTGMLFIQKAFHNKIATGFTNGGSQSGDKAKALLDIFTFTCQQGMLWVPLGILPSNNKSVANENVLNRHGYFSGMASQSFVDQPEGFNPPLPDLKTAEHFGERFGLIALKYYH